MANTVNKLKYHEGMRQMICAMVIYGDERPCHPIAPLFSSGKMVKPQQIILALTNSIPEIAEEQALSTTCWPILAFSHLTEVASQDDQIDTWKQY